MAKKMLIDATHAEETRVVVVDGNKVEEFDFESENKRQLAGNIYLAKVTRVEPSLQAAFVEYGGNRHGFLAFSEIHPDYYQIPVADREALMEEERAYAEAQRARDEDEESKPSRSRSRGRKGSRSKAAKVTSGDAVETKEVAPAKVEEPVSSDATKSETPVVSEIAGMETIDLVDEVESDEAKLAEVPEGSSPMERVADTPVEEPTVAEEASPEEEGAAQSEASVEADASVEAASENAEAAADEAPAQETSEQAAAEPAGEEAPVSEAPVAAEATSEDATVQAPELDAADKETGDGEAAKVASNETDDSGEQGEARADASSKDESIESVADEDDSEDIRPARKPRPRRYKIQEVIKVRQVLLVQVVKEERGNKGAALTTYLSLAGRYCVLMPNTARGGGISRKITNAVDRKKLKDIATEIDVPSGAGLIVRTAGAKRTKAEIKRDYEYLQRLWEQIRELTLKSVAPAKIYEEGDLIKRSIRDLYNREIDEVLVEGERGYRIAKDFMKMIMPSHAKNVKNYQETLPLFARFQVESYLGGMFNPTVQLKSGGYIVIDTTEALVAVDVNSGRATKQSSIEETALNTNLEAAEEVARQLRLRDLAGLIVIDFIDMDERKNNAAVENRMKDKLKTDRARIQVGRISGFGLMEMSRQRLRPGMIEATTQPCPHCHGTGLIRSDDSMALSILRQIEEEGTRRRSREVLVRCPIDIANYLMNQKREHIAQIETRYGLSVRIEGDAHLVSPDFTLEKFKTATRVVAVAAAPVVSVDTSLMAQIDADEAEADEDELPQEDVAEAAEAESNGEDKPKRKRRRRRRRKSGNGGENSEADSNGNEASDSAEASEAATDGDAAADTQPADEAGSEEKKPSRKRTRTRGGRSRNKKTEETAVAENTEAEGVEASTGATDAQPSAEVAAEASAPEEAAAQAEAPVAGDVTSAAADAEVSEAPADAPMAETVAETTAAEAATTEVEVAAVEETPAEEAPVVEPAEAEATKEAVSEPVAEAPEEPAVEAEPAVAAAEPEAAVAEVEPEAIAASAEPEVAVAVAEPEPAAPPKPKRRGWWSIG
ncbi:Rne/Rng family ribonuclease [Pseudophaeobacter sp.]|uniref:Rne/Rng family ribonuclease n=1 Tax=Pseudophaeobacter sp. TaxID=1971739 RepID=UPI003297EC5B